MTLTRSLTRSLQCIAIDPGSEQSALVLYDTTYGVLRHHLESNDQILWLLRSDPWVKPGAPAPPLVIEQIRSYGMAVGATVFDTVHWAGRFWEAWAWRGGDCAHMPRKDAKLHLCGSPRAKDTNIRQALIDRFGPGRQEAMGTKKTPGPLYGIRKDLWAALAVAITWTDTRVGVGCETSSVDR